MKLSGLHGSICALGSLARTLKRSHSAGVTQLVECDLAKVDVAGSNPVSRSKICPMNRLFLIPAAILSAAFSLCGQGYKLETISSPPPGLPAAYSSLIAPQGYRVVGPKGPWCEVWFRKAIPTGAKPTDSAIVFS